MAVPIVTMDPHTRTTRRFIGTPLTTSKGSKKPGIMYGRCWNVMTKRLKRRSKLVIVPHVMPCFGGHTEVFRSKVSVVGRTQSASIEYADIVLLYPAVNARDLYPTGKPVMYSPKTMGYKYPCLHSESNMEYLTRIIDHEGFCGVIKCDLKVDNTKLIPVLPQHKTGQLEFNDFDKIQATYYSQELRYAISTGDIIDVTNIHSAVGYTSSCHGLFK